jgi:uncharacterized damage-inducible protein DinB
MRSLLVMVLTGVVAAVSLTAQSAQPITQSLRTSWDAAKKNIVQSADVMPEANYGFKPVETVRTFGQILGHVAGANYAFCAAAKGEKPPHEEGAFEKLPTRAAIIKAVGESMAYCDAALAAADDRKLAEIVEMPFGMGKAARASAFVINIGHLNEHYGNLVTYFRIKGIVPPSSR